MKNFFKKIKSYSFWVSFSAALIMLLNALGKAFGFEIENQIVEDCVMSIAGILVVFGIVTMNEKGKNTEENDETDDGDEKDKEIEESLNKEKEPSENETDKQNKIDE